MSRPVDAATCWRHGPRVLGIEIAQRRLEPAVGDAGLRAEFLVVENRDAGRLASGPRGRRNREQRFQRPGHRQPLADRRVHVVEKVGRRIGGVEIDGLRGVDHRAAADGDDRIERSSIGEGDRVEERLVARFDAHAIVQRVRNLVLIQRLEHRADRRQSRKHGVGDDERQPRAHLGQVHADLARHTDAEAHAGNGHLERDVFAHRQPIMDQDAATVSDPQVPDPDVVQAFRPARHGGPEGPHYFYGSAEVRVGVISSSGSSADSTRPPCPRRRRQNESRTG